MNDGSRKKRLAHTLQRILPGPVYYGVRWTYSYALYVYDFYRFRRMMFETTKRFRRIRWGERYPCLYDRTSFTGYDAHYIYHVAWAARVIAKIDPDEHIDIASHLGFSTVVSAFVPVRFYDYRPAKLVLSNLTCGTADLAKLPFPDDSVRSLSCMHVLEHIGLGRYGEPLDPDGDMKAFGELLRVLAPGGHLLIVVPVGKCRIAFNAHRIFEFEQVVELCAGLHLVEFSLLPDDGQETGLLQMPASAIVNRQTYGCGCFWFSKLA